PAAHQVGGRHDVTATLETSGHEPVHLLSGRHPGPLRRRRARAAAGALPPDQGAVALRRLPLWDAPARAARAGPPRHRPALAAARFAAAAAGAHGAWRSTSRGKPRAEWYFSGAALA